MTSPNISKIILKRGTTAKAALYVGSIGEVVVDTDLDTLRVQDGVTQGGHLLSKQGHRHAFDDLDSLPNTLAGYGITDAAPSAHVGSNGSAHALATTVVAGFMSATDKAKLDGIASGATSVSTFLQLSDTPSAYTASANHLVRVNATGSALEFVNGTMLFPTLTGGGASGTWGISVSGNAATASKLSSAKSIGISGDLTWSVSFDGSTAVTAAATLADSGVTAGTYKSVTVDAKGRVTAGTNPTTLAGYGITDAVSSTGNAASASKLATARTISADASSDLTFSVSFDGSVNVSGTASLKTTGVTAGTYRSLTVDAKGRVTAGTNPTTRDGYGLTDVYTKSEADAKFLADQIVIDGGVLP